MGLKYPWFADQNKCRKCPSGMLELSVEFAECINIRSRVRAKEFYDKIQQSQFEPKGE